MQLAAGKAPAGGAAWEAVPSVLEAEEGHGSTSSCPLPTATRLRTPAPW